jgi:hypothetical protein
METNRFDHNHAATIPANGLIYALQTKPPSLLEFAPDGAHAKTLIANLGGRPDGVQVDATRGLIYFSMMGKPRLLDATEDFSAADGSIECCNLDGSNRRLLVGNGDIVTAKQVVLDAQGGLLYWCDREGMRVMRSRTDGGEVTTLVRTGLIPEDQKDETLHCVGVAIDRESGHIYWTQKGPSDGGKGRIFRAGLELPADASPDDRGDVELLMDNLPEPIDLDIDHGAHVLYWTDRGNLTDGNTLNRALIRDSGLSEHRVVTRGLQEGIGLSLDPKARRAFVSDLGGTVRVIDLDEGRHEEILFHRGRLTGITFVRPEST